MGDLDALLDVMNRVAELGGKAKDAKVLDQLMDMAEVHVNQVHRDPKTGNYVVTVQREHNSFFGGCERITKIFQIWGILPGTDAASGMDSAIIDLQTARAAFQEKFLALLRNNGGVTFNGMMLEAGTAVGAAGMVVVYKLRGLGTNSILARGTRAREVLGSLGKHNFPVDAQAHHIFGVELFDTPLGKKLHSWGVDLNGAGNGVYLPKYDFTGNVASLHRGRTGKDYTNEVVSRLGAARASAHFGLSWQDGG